MIVQLLLAVFGLTGLWMALSPRPVLRHWAPFVGVLAQPFWLWFAVDSHAWGMFAISLAYTGVYLGAIRKAIRGTI